MATAIDRGVRTTSLAPDMFERMLAIGAIVLLGCVVVAIGRGQAQWSRVPMLVWGHLATIGVALALTPIMLLRRRGDARHRVLGAVWLVSMMATALMTFGIRLSNPGGFSLIHILSVWTLFQVPLIWWSAHSHRIAMHRRAVRGMVFGALLIAGFFTFPFDRLLGHWLFG